jgi:hypothetical protein
VKTAVGKRTLALRAAFTEWKDTDKARRSERDVIKKFRPVIEEIASEFSTWLSKPTPENHVPKFMQESILSVLDEIDFGGKTKKDGSIPNTKKGASWLQAVEYLKNELYKTALANSTDSAVSETVDEKYREVTLLLPHEFIGNFEWLVNRMKARGVTRVMDMDGEETRELATILRILRHSVKNVNKLYSNMKYETVSALGDSTIAMSNGVKERGEFSNVGIGKALGIGDRLLNFHMLDSYSWGEMLRESGVSVINELSRGTEKAYTRIREGAEFMEGLQKKHRFDGIKIEQWSREKHGFTLFDGSKITLSTVQIMEIYALSNRPQAVYHLMGGGIEISGIETGIKKTVQNRAYQLTGADVSAIISKLTTSQKSIVDDMQKFLSTTASAWGNETSMELFLYEAFKEPTYWPINTSRVNLDTQDPDAVRAFNAAQNQGMTKQTVKYAQNPIVIGDVFQTYTDHIAHMATYNGLSAPLGDALKWLNYKQREGRTVDYNATVKRSIRHVMGEQGVKYLVTLIKDINGLSEGSTGTEITSALIANAKRSAVAANLRVIIQQPTAVFRALALLDPKYMLKAVFTTKSIQEMRDHSPIAWWKAQGNFDIGTGRSMRGIIIGADTNWQKIVGFSMKGAAAADDVSWSFLWNAVKLEISDTTDLKYGTKEYFEAVSERFSEIVNRTQVVDSVMHRPQIMRSKDKSIGQVTAFMSEPIKSYNLIRSAIIRLNQYPKDKEAKRKLIMAIIGFLLAMSVNSAILALYDSARKRGDEEKDGLNFGQRYGKNIVGNILDGVNPLSYIPYAKDLLSILQGYDIERMDMASIGA